MKRLSDDFLETLGLATYNIKKIVGQTYEDIVLDKEYFSYGNTELVLDREGFLYKLKPAHIYTLMSIIGYKTQDEAYEEIPIDANVIHWLIEKSGCIAIWSNMYINPSYGITEKQKESIKKLYEGKYISYLI